MLNQEWEIKPRGTGCKVCQRAFSNGQGYVSSLRIHEQEYERADCCETCWQKEKDAWGNAFSVWKGTYQAVLPPPEVLKKETAESLLRKLIEQNDPAHRNAIFILAVMLERKKILSEKKVEKNDDASVVRVYEHRHTGDTFIITDPMLALDQIRNVQEEIAALISLKPSGEADAGGDPGT